MSTFVAGYVHTYIVDPGFRNWPLGFASTVFGNCVFCDVFGNCVFLYQCPRLWRAMSIQHSGPRFPKLASWFCFNVFWQLCFFVTFLAIVFFCYQCRRFVAGYVHSYIVDPGFRNWPLGFASTFFGNCWIFVTRSRWPTTRKVTRACSASKCTLKTPSFSSTPASRRQDGLFSVHNGLF
jgi:hypothetical protein